MANTARESEELLLERQSIKSQSAIRGLGGPRSGRLQTTRIEADGLQHGLPNLPYRRTAWKRGGARLPSSKAVVTIDNVIRVKSSYCEGLGNVGQPSVGRHPGSPRRAPIFNSFEIVTLGRGMAQ